MSGMTSLLIGMLVGAGLGYLASHLPVTPFIQSVGAAVLSGVVVSVGRALLWLTRTSDEAGIAAVSVGLAESLMGLVMLGILALGVHWVVGWAGGALHPSLTAYRPVILGLLGGLCGALAFPAGAVFRGTP